jgi:glucose-1-phosphate thymidylyltransferase
VDTWCKDTRTVEDVLLENMLVLNKIELNVDKKDIKGKVLIGKHTKISDDPLIRGPAVIGYYCEIEKSFIGPYMSIGYNCIMEDASIENSIVMKGSRIESHNHIADSIIWGGIIDF